MIQVSTLRTAPGFAGIRIMLTIVMEVAALTAGLEIATRRAASTPGH